MPDMSITCMMDTCIMCMANMSMSMRSISLQPIPNAARPSTSVPGISRNMRMGRIVVTKPFRTEITSITWWMAIYIIRTTGTATIMATLPLPAEPVNSGWH